MAAVELNVVKISGTDVYGFCKANIREEAADLQSTEKDKWNVVNSSDLVSKGKGVRSGEISHWAS